MTPLLSCSLPAMASTTGNEAVELFSLIPSGRFRLQTRNQIIHTYMPNSGLLTDASVTSCRLRVCSLPAMASTTGNEAVELSSFASGTGKSSSERLKVIQVHSRDAMKRCQHCLWVIWVYCALWHVFLLRQGHSDAPGLVLAS